MTSWMRAQPLPIFFLVSFLGVLVPVLLAWSIIAVLAFHSHMTMSDVISGAATALVSSSLATIGERSQR